MKDIGYRIFTKMFETRTHLNENCRKAVEFPCFKKQAGIKKLRKTDFPTLFFKSRVVAVTSDNTYYYKAKP